MLPLICLGFVSWRSAKSLNASETCTNALTSPFSPNLLNFRLQIALIADLLLHNRFYMFNFEFEIINLLDPSSNVPYLTGLI